ncbi:carboxymuconolactone decarboxylase family protein [Paraburkholderia tropica]|uniref:carboxymuconolactone decarboxylase family protein n=1 Tax=Paraburkholderia tropica TaxID=92647 RepID=UPI002AAFC6F4|nr:carboxymuconolactone decarboxylase family protein [Paraburkholderia tropica]
MSEIDNNGDLLNKFHPDGVNIARETVLPVFPDLVNKIVFDIYGFAYRRGGLDIKTRHLVSLAAISAMGGAENQLRFQLKAALNLGLTVEEVREVFIQVAVFAGNARAFNAAAVFGAIVKELENEK